jgi:hypothetical protein
VKATLVRGRHLPDRWAAVFCFKERHDLRLPLSLALPVVVFCLTSRCCGLTPAPARLYPLWHLSWRPALMEVAVSPREHSRSRLLRSVATAGPSGWACPQSTPATRGRGFSSYDS